MDQIKRFFKEEEGLELSEYAIMAALVIAVAAAVITSVGTQISAVFTDLLGHLGG